MTLLLNEYRKQILDVDNSFPIKREIYGLLSNEIKNHNLCLVGLRQVGKTTLILQLAKYFFDNYIDVKLNTNQLITNVVRNEEKIFYINLKSIQNINDPSSYNNLLKEITNKKYELIVLDEIQEISNWTNFIQSAIDLNNDARFIISGSSATALTSETMVGRIKIHFIKPLSFNEYKSIWNDDSVENYLTYGSYPKNKNYASCFIQYKELVKDSIIDKIINEDQQKNIDGTKFFALLSDINNYIGNEINYSKLERKNITRQTVANYLKVMKNSQLIHLIPQYLDKNTTRKQKIYYEDKSMINYFNNFEQLDNNLKGSLIENVVFNYLNNKYMNEWSINQIFYLRNNKEQEIDFILPNQKLLIECKYTNNIDHSSILEHFNEVISIHKKINSFKKIVITKEYDELIDGVKYISLKKFLENKNEEW